MDELSDEPEEVKEVFDWYRENFGFVPNLAKVLSGSPAALRSYWLSQLQLQKHGLLTPEEHNVNQMAIGVENRCKYSASGHQLAGDLFFNSDSEDLVAIRNEDEISNKKFNALRAFALEVYRHKGRVKDSELREFISAGYSKSQAVEMITNIGVKVMANLTNQLAMTSIDDQFAPLAEGLFENSVEVTL